MSKSLYQTNVESRAPLTTDVGVVGNWWVDTSVSPADLYLCTGATGGVYTWTKQGGGSGGGVQESAEMTMTEASTFIANHNIIKGEFTILQNISSSFYRASIDSSATVTYNTGTYTYDVNEKYETNYSKVQTTTNTVHEFKSIGGTIFRYTSMTDIWAISKSYTSTSSSNVEITQNTGKSLSNSNCKVKFYYI